MIPLLLILLFSNCVCSCKEVSTDCNGVNTFDVTKFTIDQVIADIKETLKESHDFYAKYERDLHTFTHHLESKLRADKIMLERLLKLQDRHGSQFTKTPEFYRFCEEHLRKKCITGFENIEYAAWSEYYVVDKAIVINESQLVCPSMTGRSSVRLQLNYKNEEGSILQAGNEFECSNGTWFTAGINVTGESKIIEAKSIGCAIDKNQVCESLVRSEEICENCTKPVYDSNNMIYTCTKNYAFDLNEETRQVRCEFVGTQVELVYEANGTSETFNGELMCLPLPPRSINPCPYTCAETAECIDDQRVCVCLKGYVDVSMQYGKQSGSICTKCNYSHPHGTDYVMIYDTSSSISNNSAKMADFVSDFLKFINIDNSDNRFSLVQFGTYASVRLPMDPKRKQKDIMDIITDLQYNGATNTGGALKVTNDEVYKVLQNDSPRPRTTILFTDGHPVMCSSPASDEYVKDECILNELRNESKTMRETHKAQILTIYIGRKTEQIAVERMRAITSEDEEINVEDFNELKKTGMDKLQLKIC